MDEPENLRNFNFFFRASFVRSNNVRSTISMYQISFVQFSRKPLVFFSWLLRTLLASVTPIINAELLQSQQQQQQQHQLPQLDKSTPSETFRLLGVLLALRHLMAQMASDKQVGVDDWLKPGSSFGMKSTNNASTLPKEGQSSG